MTVKWLMSGGKSARLVMGLWLLMGQVALSESAQPEVAEGNAKPKTDAPSALIEAALTATTQNTGDNSLPLSAGVWPTQTAQAQPVEITTIQIEATDEGFTLRLEASGELTTPETSVTGNAAIADIPNAVLQLPDSEEFLASNPAAGIALIDVVNLPDNQVRIAITGTDAPPVVNLSIAPTGLIITGMSGNPTVQIPNEDAIQVVVTGEGDDDDYFVPEASAATRTDTPLRDVPQSIQVIPRQVIEDQQATGLEEVLENAAGVTFLGNDDGRGFNFSIRGFDNAPVLRDGFLLPALGGDAASPEVANLEQVEVLRGPASVLYGQAEPGGVINLVTKQPLAEPYYNVQLQGGNRGFISPSLDFSGPLTEDGRLRYRLNALVRREDSFRNYDNNFERSFIAPTLTWLVSDRTEVTFNAEYSEDNEPADYGTVAFGDGIADIPPERVTNNPEDTVERDYLNAGYTLEHRFSDNWQLRNQFRYTSSSFVNDVLAIPIALNESAGILNRLFVAQSTENDTYSLYTNIQGEFSTGPVQHTLLLGLDWTHEDRDVITRFDPVNPALATPINIFNPDYSAIPRPRTEDINISVFGSTATRTDQLGLYLQDQIDILDNLILVAGLRYNTVNQETTNLVTDVETDQNDDAFIPRIGIVYQPTEPISLYANYSRSFVPNTATDADGDPLEPEEGGGFEVGIRGEIIENRLSANLAYFDITKQNVATADPNNPFASVATGEQRSRGVDFSLTGEILPGWNVVASYAYIDAEVTEDNNTDIVGNRLPSVPEHSASLWTTYEIQSGDFQGLGFGLGFNFVGERKGDLADSFEVDSYFLTNAAVFYRQNDWRVQLNVENLFNVDYIESVNNSRTRQIYPGDPLTVRASVSYTF